MRTTTIAMLVAVACASCSKKEKKEVEKARYSVTTSADGRVAYRLDGETGQTWVSHNGAPWRELESPEIAERRRLLAERQQAATERRRIARAQEVEAINAQFPRRLQKFATAASITILSAEERVSLRGRQGVILGEPSEICDPESAVVWKLSYPVRVDGTTYRVDADKLALVGSVGERDDLSGNLPATWARIENQRQEKRRRVADAAKARQLELEQARQAKRLEVEHLRRVKARLAANPSLVQTFQFGDKVRVLSSDPRRAIRGLAGEIVIAENKNYETIAGERVLLSVDYRVYFPSLGAGEVRTRVVEAKNLRRL